MKFSKAFKLMKQGEKVKLPGGAAFGIGTQRKKLL